MPTLVAGGPVDLGDETETLVSSYGKLNAGGIIFGDAQLIQGIPFEEVDGYGETWRNDGTQEITRCFKVPWSFRFLFRDAVLGYSNSTGSGITRQIPWAVPEAGGQHLFASDLKLKQCCGAWGLNPTVFTQNLDGSYTDTPAPMIAYFDGASGGDGLAVYEVQFTPRDYEIRSDTELAAMTSTASTLELERFVERKRSSAITTAQYPANSVVWANGRVGGIIPAGAGFIYIATEALIYEWIEVPDDPRDAIALCQGRVNATAFDGAKGARSYPAGTLLCQAPLLVERRRHTTGRIRWKVIYSFLHKEFTNPHLPGQVLGWNSLADNDGLTWPISLPNGNPVVPSADFNGLFKAPPAVTYQ